jgi:predicted GNAT family N-acyltransferase
MQKFQIIQTDFEGEVWCITCLIISAEYGGLCLSEHIVKEAVEYAIENAADSVGAFPSVVKAQRYLHSLYWERLAGNVLKKWIRNY